ncbi:hypothetical protein H4R18_005724 [Coemansia javaensis]|uniref:Uncharacterized protein n=1 Tax=Coemansia javaensis TaxID=2761396 RepID=A0A9W8H1L2_9FUNG|nr:hypothetical protein H4R18_005724 [Coemansia javaensis]
MQLRDLPDDGLRLVFEAFLKTRYSKTFMLKTNLPLLAVCRSAGDSSGVIEFPNLKKLKLSYRSTRASDGVEPRHPDGHPWRLHFPRLGKLDVSCDQDRCPLLEYAVFPPHMYEISINAATSMLMHVAEMTLSASENLKIAVSPTSNGDPAALATANRILKGARESKRVELRVSDCSLVVLPESITCTSLTALSIDADTSVDTVLGLIRMLPNLGSLHIWHLTLHDIQEDISVPGPDEARLVEPFNARIKEMSIEASLDGRRLEMLVPVAKYLLLRTPALTRFWSEVLPRGPIEEFFNAYSKRYPHLSSIICVLKSTYD